MAGKEPETYFVYLRFTEAYTSATGIEIEINSLSSTNCEG